VSIDDLGSIDIIAHKPGSSDVQLVISDHWDWTDVHRHCYQLQEKLNTYFGFVEAGELHARPDIRAIANPDICFAIFCVYEPPPAAREFIAKVQAAVEGEGYRFRFEVRPLDGFIN
jgi:hypothetical protein